MVNKKKLTPYIPLILSLLLALVLFFIVEDFVKMVVVRPLLYVIWFVSLIMQSIPQEAIWIGFILLMLLLTYASLTKEKTPRLPIRTLPLTRKLSPFERWARLFENAQNSSLSKWRLSQELKHLTRNVISPNLDPEDNSRDLSSLDLPAEIRAFFEAQQPSNKRLSAIHDESETALDLDPEVVIQYLEERLRS